MKHKLNHHRKELPKFERKTKFKFALTGLGDLGAELGRVLAEAPVGDLKKANKFFCIPNSELLCPE